MKTIYSKEQIVLMCEKAAKDMKSFYKQNFINYRGNTKEGLSYTEVVAEWLLNHMDKFSEIQQIERKANYKTPNHDGEINRETNRKEEITAKMLFKMNVDFDGFGRIIDYQTPLKNVRGDNGSGKIDLLSVNKSTKCIYILELKKEDSKETMLRCVLEAYTYRQIVSQKKLFEDFEIEKDYELKASPLVYVGSVQYNEFFDNKREMLHELMKKLDSTPFFIDENITYQIKAWD